MQPRNSSLFHFTVLTVLAAAILFAASALAQATYANKTFTVVVANDDHGVGMHVRSTGGRCWASTSSSAGNSIGIAIMDEKCVLRDEDIRGNPVLVARIRPNNISFQLAGKSYSISDANTVKSARSLFDPLASIEAQQSDLGDKQSNLGKKQNDLGRRQRDVKVNVPDMSADFLKIEAEVKRLSSQGGTQAELGDLQSQLGELQGRIGELQSVAGDAQSKLGDQQSELGDQQSQLGEQESALGEQATALIPNIADKLRVMLNQAVSSGTAKPE